MLFLYFLNISLLNTFRDDENKYFLRTCQIRGGGGPILALFKCLMDAEYSKPLNEQQQKFHDPPL